MSDVSVTVNCVEGSQKRPLGAALSASLALFIAISAIDLLFYGYDPLGEAGFIRHFLHVIPFIPLMIRWPKELRPIENDRGAFEAYVRWTLLLPGLLLGVIILQILPLELNDNNGPADFRSFLLLRLLMAILIWAAGSGVGTVTSLFRYGEGRGKRGIELFGWGFILIVLSLPLPFDQEFGIELSWAIAGACAILALYYGLRASWVIHLKKAEKYRIVWLSALGFASGAGVIAFFMGGAGAETTIHGSYVAIGFAIGLTGLAAQIGFGFRALITLPTAGAIDRRNTELASLVNFGRLMTESFDRDELLKVSTAIACEVTGGDESWIETFDDARDDQRMIIGSANVDVATAASVMATPITGNGIDIAADARSRTGVRLFNLQLRDPRASTGGEGAPARDPAANGSVAVVPLRVGGKEHGALYVLKRRANGFDRQDTSILNAVADQIALAMDHSTLIRRSIDQERLQGEMVIAREAQRRFLPRTLPESPFFELYGESEPASMVGGDYYDVVGFSDHRIGIVIADVSGKGASAALVMGMVKGVVRALSGICADPVQLLTHINASLHGNLDPRSFVTMTCASIFEEERRLVVARAGHCPTLVVRGSEAFYGTPPGIGLALVNTTRFGATLAAEEIDCAPGDVVIFFSDGLVEIRSPDDEELGFDRLRTIAAEAVRSADSARMVRDAIYEGISTFTRGAPPDDDRTIVVLRWR